MHTIYLQRPVCLTISDSCGTNSVCLVVVNTAVGLPGTLQGNVKHSPIPVSDAFQVEGLFHGTISVIDCKGRVLWSSIADLKSGDPLKIDAINWESAIYFIHFQSERECWTQKLPVH